MRFFFIYYPQRKLYILLVLRRENTPLIAESAADIMLRFKYPAHQYLSMDADAKKLYDKMIESYPYTAIIPFDLTNVPLVASAEMSKDLVTADNMFKLLLRETYEFKDDDGHKHTHFHPELGKWFDRKTKLLIEIG